jgi:hypothetical protein
MVICKQLSGLMILGLLPLVGCTSISSGAQPSTLTHLASTADSCASERIDPIKCVPAERSYSKSDIYRTGSTTVADALRLLDPAITIHQ